MPSGFRLKACLLVRSSNGSDEWIDFRLLGRTGFVSDDTEQTALLAQSLVRHPADLDRCVEAFRKSLLGWFCRLPWGIGRATLRSCLRIALGIHPSGVVSAGNGAAMRAAILGAFFHDQPEARQAFGRAIAEVTHRDERAVEGAIYVAEMAAACVRSPIDSPRHVIQSEARQVVRNPQLGSALDQSRDLAEKEVSTHEAAKNLWNFGFRRSHRAVRHVHLPEIRRRSAVCPHGSGQRRGRHRFHRGDCRRLGGSIARSQANAR